MITSGQISVVVQGPVMAEGRTAECLRSVRNILPQAQVILSTWKGSNTAGLEFDRLIENEDPGGFKSPNGVMYNLARQITSTMAGLRQTDREYALKLRTDGVLAHDGFLRGWDDFPQRTEDFSVFAHRITASDHFFCDVGKVDGKNLFHISDIVLFGLTEDLKKLWDVPLPISLRDVKIVSRIPLGERYESNLIRYLPEQWLWLKCLQKQGVKVDLNYHWQFSKKLALVSESSMLNNFRILSLANLGVNLPPRLSKEFPDWMMEEADWEKLYKIYCAEKDAAGLQKARLDLLAKLHRQRVADWLRLQVRHYSVRAVNKLRSVAKKRR